MTDPELAGLLGPFFETPHSTMQHRILTRSPGNEARFLVGKRDRGDELAATIRIFMEFLHGVDGMQVLDRPCVTVFGSARFKPGHPYYEMARAVGGALARAGFAVMTGGGPGVMEAANRGADEAGGLSLGCTIALPFEEASNPYVDHVIEFDHFFVRKVMLVKYSQAFIMMPGGFGTLDEMFETLTLMQTGKVRRFPVVAMGADFWSHLRTFVQNALVAHGTISPEDIRLLQITDDAEEAVQLIRDGLDGMGEQQEAAAA